MAKYMKQFRYFGNASLALDDEAVQKVKNYPTTINKAMLSTNATELFGSCLPITKLGIQTLPGVKFYLNFSPMTNPIIVGSTGRFELDLENSAATITDIYFDGTSIDLIDNTPGAYLIIDMLCGED